MRHCGVWFRTTPRSVAHISQDSALLNVRSSRRWYRALCEHDLMGYIAVDGETVRPCKRCLKASKSIADAIKRIQKGR